MMGKKTNRFSKHWKLFAAVMGLAVMMLDTAWSESGLEAWSAALAGHITPAPLESVDAGEARAHLMSLLESAVPDSIKSFQWSEPVYRGTNGGGRTWSMTAEIDGLHYTWGGRQRDDQWQPVFFSVTGLPSRSGASFEEAFNVVRLILLADKMEGKEVQALRSLSQRDHVRLETWHGRSIEAPWREYWVFMLDDAPLANWAHPCRYVFISSDLSSVAVRYALTPLSAGPVSARSLDEINEMETIIPFVPISGRDIKKRSLPTLRSGTIRYDGHVSNCYAVIVSGGYNKANNHIRYWGDASFVYSTLTLKYSYPKTNIYVLISDGLDPANDRSDDSNSPWDLDGDGLDDTRDAATAVNVSNVFIELQSLLTTNDQLFVFFTDHGGPTDGGGEWDVELNLWNMEVLRDVDLKALTEPIACPIFFAMEQCYSGGFLNDLDQTNRAVATAAYYNESSYAGDTYPWFDQWAYHWIAAMRGFYPQTNEPWIDTESCDGDLNDDGYVSFEEAYQYAYAHKYEDDHPMYGDTPSGLGKRSFLSMPWPEDVGMGEFQFDPVETQCVAHAGFPVCLTAQNVFGMISSNYDGNALLQTEAMPDDPGRYIGTNKTSWIYPFNTYYMDARTQVIYPAELMGEARELDHLALEIVTPPPMALSNWTIRMKHTALNAYPANAQWEATGWTTVYASNQTIAATGWVVFIFSQPFEYDGAQNLMVDFSYHNGNYYMDNGVCCASSVTNYVSICASSDNADGDPLLWEGEIPGPTRNSLFPNLRFGPPATYPTVLVAPTQLTGFVDGVWQGTVTVWKAASGVRLWARDSTNTYRQGCTDWFSILAYGATHYVDAAGTNPVSPYLDWETAATVIQDAIDAADAGDRLLVSNGVYATGGRPATGYAISNRVAVDKVLIVQSVNGPAVTTVMGAPDPGTGGLGVDATRGVFLAEGASLDGFTITNGYTHYSYSIDAFGGGIYSVSVDTLVSNCVIGGNTAWAGGGGAYRGTLRYCELVGNHSEFGGGGAEDTLFDHCEIMRNEAATGGGGYHVVASNSIFHGNMAQDGGGLYESDVYSCTVVSNQGVLTAGGVHGGRIVNSIVHGNESSGDPDSLNWYTGAVHEFQYSCTWPLPSGSGNVSANPALTADFRLMSNSPCVNTGLNEDWMTGATDLAGSNRIQNVVADMGAYESEWWGVFADVDDDGYTDATEVNITGTDPADAESFLGVSGGGVQDSGGEGIVVRWRSVADKLYNVDRATNLTGNPAFTNIRSGITGLSDSTSITDATATAEGPYFYRVGIEP